ncbi:fos-related antigen 2-like [Arapaima gigas]
MTGDEHGLDGVDGGVMRGEDVCDKEVRKGVIKRSFECAERQANFTLSALRVKKDRPRRAQEPEPTASCRELREHRTLNSTLSKYRVDMPVSSSTFIPTINAITSSQDLQWMLQPTVITAMSSPRHRLHPYDNPGLLSHTRPGVIRSVGEAQVRCKRNEQLSPEEEEKRKLRRERNKMAAAKCRSRRRELTDRLQGETEKLEEEKAGLQKEIETLQLEKDKLELVLVSHKPICQLAHTDQSHNPDPNPLSPSGYQALGAVVVKQEPLDDLNEQEVAPSTHKTPSSIIKPTSYEGRVLGMYCLDGNGASAPAVTATTSAFTPTSASSMIRRPGPPEQDSLSSGPEAKSTARSQCSGHQDQACSSPTLMPL